MNTNEDSSAVATVAAPTTTTKVSVSAIDSSLTNGIDVIKNENETKQEQTAQLDDKQPNKYTNKPLKVKHNQSYRYMNQNYVGMSQPPPYMSEVDLARWSAAQPLAYMPVPYMSHHHHHHNPHHHHHHHHQPHYNPHPHYNYTNYATYIPTTPLPPPMQTIDYATQQAWHKSTMPTSVPAVQFSNTEQTSSITSNVLTSNNSNNTSSQIIGISNGYSKHSYRGQHNNNSSHRSYTKTHRKSSSTTTTAVPVPETKNLASNLAYHNFPAIGDQSIAAAPSPFANTTAYSSLLNKQPPTTTENPINSAESEPALTAASVNSQVSRWSDIVRGGQLPNEQVTSQVSQQQQQLIDQNNNENFADNKNVQQQAQNNGNKKWPATSKTSGVESSNGVDNPTTASNNDSNGSNKRASVNNQTQSYNNSLSYGSKTYYKNNNNYNNGSSYSNGYVNNFQVEVSGYDFYNSHNHHHNHHQHHHQHQQYPAGGFQQYMSNFLATDLSSLNLIENGFYHSNPNDFINGYMPPNKKYYGSRKNYYSSEADYAATSSSLAHTHTHDSGSGALVSFGNNAELIDSKFNSKDFQYSGEAEGTKDSRFFIIKSYSKEDVVHAINHNLWCSTESGNARLNQAFAQKTTRPNMSVYLFFSVNGSGQFCGMAEMASGVDFDAKCPIWTQDKWKGKFEIKWIYVKDIPNNKFKHVLLPNNENKPVTNSRDCQEVPFEQACEVLSVFKTFNHRSTILDDVDMSGFESQQPIGWRETVAAESQNKKIAELSAKAKPFSYKQNKLASASATVTAAAETTATATQDASSNANFQVKKILTKSDKLQKKSDEEAQNELVNNIIETESTTSVTEVLK